MSTTLTIKQVIKELKKKGEKSKFFRSIKKKFKKNGELNEKQERALRDLLESGKERKKVLLKCLKLFPKDKFVISVKEFYESSGFISKAQFENLVEKIEDDDDDDETSSDEEVPPLEEQE